MFFAVLQVRTEEDAWGVAIDVSNVVISETAFHRFAG